MNWLLPKLSMRHKLTALTFLPLLAVSWFQVQDSLEHRAERSKVAELNELLEVSMNAGDLLHFLQLERGATAVYLASDGTKFATTLSEQRHLTDTRLSDFVSLVNEQSSNLQPEVNVAAADALKILDNLSSTRNLISAQSISETDAIDFYTSTNAVLLQVFNSIQLAVDDANLARGIVSYSALATGKEATGIELALMAKVFGKNELADGELVAVVELISKRDAYFEVFARSASPELLVFFERQQSNPLVAEVSNFEALIVQDGKFDVDSSLWFDTMSRRIDLLQTVEDAQSAELTTRSTEVIAASDTSIRNAIVSVLFVLTFTLLFIATIAKLSRSFDLVGRTLNLVGDQLNAVSKSDLENEALDEAVPGELGTAIEALIANSRDRSELLDDVTAQAIELRASSKDLELTKNRFETLLESAFEAILIADKSDKITYVSGPFEQITGIPPDLFIGQPFNCFIPFVHPDDVKPAERFYYSISTEPENSGSTEFRFLHGDGSWRWIDFYIRNLLHDESIQGIVINAREITEQKNAAAQLEELAHHDSLTGLPNRRLLVDQLEHALARTSRHGGNIALIYLDLDDFKTINDSMGHAAGDQLLSTTARRIKSLIRTTDTAARFGGDEFVILCDGLKSTEEISSLAERIISSINEPVKIGNEYFSVTTSMGISTATDGDVDSNGLLEHADTAMYRAKQLGKNRYEIHNSKIASS